MNTKHCARSLFVALGVTVIFCMGYAAGEKQVGPIVAPTHAVVTMSVSAPAPSPGSGFGFMVMPPPDVDSVRWNEIKDQAYSSRAQFIAALKQMEQRVGDQLGELKMKRAALKGSSGDQNSELAIKELGYARSYLKYMVEEMNKATPDNWNQQKAKIGQAWVRTQEFYTMGKSGLTS